MDIYMGTVKDGVVLLPEGVNLPQGLTVEIRVPEKSAEIKNQAELEHQFKQKLLKKGLLAEVKLPLQVSRRTIPVSLKGKLLSEMILEERR